MGNDDVERDARDMIKLYGAAAARIARVRAETAEKHVGNQHLVQTWRSIADAIERLPSN